MQVGAVRRVSMAEIWVSAQVDAVSMRIDGRKAERKPTNVEGRRKMTVSM
jgi:hypothetical protein